MQLIIQLFKYLNSNTNYAVLRNHEGLPYSNKSRDIDILIEKKEYNRIKKDIVDIIVAEGYKIITYFESERIHTFVCGLTTPEKTDIIQFDFFFRTSVYGVTVINASDMLLAKQFNGEVYHVSKEYEFLDKFLYLKLLGIPYPKKYAELEKLMTENKTVDNIINQLFGEKSLESLKEKQGKQLMLKKLVRNLKSSFVNQTSNVISFWVAYICNLLSPKGFSVGFTGPDGSGKTTVLEIIYSELEHVYSGIKLFHFRPTILPNIGEAACNAGIKKEVDRDYNNPHRGSKTGIISSSIRLCYYSVDYIIGYWIKIRPLLHQRSVVLFDRYYTDIIADSRRSRIHLNYKFLTWFRHIIPSLNYNILLTASSETILKRKQELDAPGIESINKKLDYLATKSDYQLVLNESTPQEAVFEILSHIFEQQHIRNCRKL